MEALTRLLRLLTPLLAGQAFLAGVPGDLSAQESPAPPAVQAHPLRGEIRIDGRLDEGAWGAAAPVSGFLQIEPVEGAPARNDTEIRVLYDDEALYIGARLHDASPGTIARSLTRRDAGYAGQYDLFAVLIDPDLDRRTGYEFQVSAANVQLDRYLFDDDRADLAWDAVWASAVAIDDGGWSVEIRIPFSQIRHEASAEEQVWGINFVRRRAADNETTAFALESRLVSGRVSQFGLLKGIRTESPPARVEVRPYALTRARRAPAVPGDPFFNGQEFGTEVGFDVRYGLGASFTLDATVNPDFGQVEADPAVINLSAFETFFPERRPFFVEDARIFDFGLSGPRNQLLYSRRIGRAPELSAPRGADFADVSSTARILGAAKLTGRTVGGLSLGALAAITGSEAGRAYFLEEDRVEPFDAEPRTAYGVLRARQDFRDSGTRVGAIVTGVKRSLPESGELRLLPSEAFTFGVDFEHTWADREWALTGFLAGSRVQGDPGAILRIQRSSTHYFQRPDLEGGFLDPEATSLVGAEWRLQVERRRGRWQGGAWADRITRGREVNDIGFATTPERVSGAVRIEYRGVAPGRWHRNYYFRFFSRQDLSHELFEDILSLDRLRWARTQAEYSLTGNVSLRNFWTVNASVSVNPDAMSRRATRGGPRMEAPGRTDWSLNLSTDDRRRVSLRPTLGVARGARESGNAFRAGLRVRVQPSERVELQMEPRFVRSTDGAQYVAATSAVPYEPTFGARYLFADLDRRELSVETRLTWIFTPQLSLELFAQPLLASTDFVTYKQLARSESFDFERFQEGTFRSTDIAVACDGGRTCVAPDGVRWIDLDASGTADISFPDRDFNVRSLRATAVLRWEYRPGSTVYLVWQRRQSETLPLGGLDLARDGRALMRVPSEDVFIVKANVWLAF